MKKIFTKSRQGSDSGPRRAAGPEPESTRSRPHEPRYAGPGIDASKPEPNDDDLYVTDTLLEDDHTVASVPLSESNTLQQPRRQSQGRAGVNQERVQLQDTFAENFHSYLPFLIRKARNEQQQSAAASSSAPSSGGMYMNEDLNSSSETVTSAMNQYQVLDQSMYNFNEKRSLTIAQEMMKNSILVFINEESFNLFKELKSLKKEKASSVAPGYHSRGLGLPLLKMETHSLIRKDDGADIVFSTVKPESAGTATASDEASSKFCTVHVKSTSDVKRYTFTFTPADAPAFKVILFQHNMKPIADFVYKDTRFRFFGNSMINYGLAPNFKLLVLDKKMPGLHDFVFDKPQFKLSSIVRNRRLSTSDSRSKEDAAAAPETDPLKMANPYPHASNPLVKYAQYEYLQQHKSYVSNDLPPFGSFQDAICYKNDYTIMPKKYRELGRLEVYQASAGFTSNTNTDSNASIDIDTLVLTCISLAVRDGVVRRNSQVHSNIELANRYNFQNGAIYSNHGSPLGGIF